jgi:RNA polymerase sigma factor (sigma-70 family)
MAETTWAALRALLVDRYAEFKTRLTRQLGSEELATESLHETWLRLDRPGYAGVLQSAPAYLLRIAANIATDRLRAERSRRTQSQVDATLQIIDPAPDPGRHAAGRVDIEVVARVLKELPSRSRTILVASRLEGLSHQAIADRLGISRRTVLYELKRAVLHLETRLENSEPKNCAREPSKPSEE